MNARTQWDVTMKRDAIPLIPWDWSQPPLVLGFGWSLRLPILRLLFVDGTFMLDCLGNDLAVDFWRVGRSRQSLLYLSG